ncbi:hypothetical protein HanIR_Chr09g0422991 [Helianthus annuus]|nr:hypothetical protein HanIR_Chr09g0422991 [Helianthus annuus]
MGCTIMPEIGPQSQMYEDHLCGIPNSWTYGVKRESCRAHPNCTPAAMAATVMICHIGRGGGGDWFSSCKGGGN